MDNLFITLFITIANVVAISLTYHSFDKGLDKNKKMLYTMLGIGTVYIVLLIVYFFSSIGIAKEASSNAKNMITFTFVPVNTIIMLPALIKSFNKRKNNVITTEQLNRRTILIILLAVIVLISEFFYFRDIQKGIIKFVEQKQNEENSISTSNVIENTENLENLEGNLEENLEENVVQE